MKLPFNLGIQIACLALQMLVPDIPGITPEWVRFSHTIVAFLQAAVALIAHYRNPDGTSASVGWQKK